MWKHKQMNKYTSKSKTGCHGASPKMKTLPKLKEGENTADWG